MLEGSLTGRGDHSTGNTLTLVWFSGGECQRWDGILLSAEA